MASPIREITFKFLGDAASLERASSEASKSLGGVDDRLGKISDRMGKFGKGLSVGVTAPLVGAFTVGFNSLRENEALLAQTNAVIESMGGSAGVTADGVFDLANKISNLSGVAHESVVEGQNLLLTFGNVRNEVGEGNDVFDQATMLMTDMSVALGQDMKSGAIQLGKALNDPIKGVTALQRVGVSFTEEQKNQIRVLQESGDTLGAQKLILGELEKQFGGSAEAAGETMTGSLNKLKNSSEQLFRNLATFLVPVFERLTEILQKALDWFNNLDPGMQKTVQTLAVVAAAVGPVLIVGAKLIKSFQAIMTAFRALSALMAANPWLLLIAAVVALVIIIVKNWDKITAAIQTAWEFIKAGAQAAWDFMKRVWQGIVDAFRAAFDWVVNFVKNWTLVGLLTGHGDGIKRVFQGVKDFIVNIWNSVVDFVTGLPGRLASAASGMWDGIKQAFRGAINWIIDKWNGLSLRIGGKTISLGPLGSFTIPSITLNTPNIPRFHAGGTFTTPTPGGEGLAILRDGERVLPAGSRVRPLVVQLVTPFGRVLAEQLVEFERSI